MQTTDILSEPQGRLSEPQYRKKRVSVELSYPQETGIPYNQE